MKIALAQLNYTVGDIEGNTSKIIEAIDKAKYHNADLLVFAEQAVSGTPAYDLLNKVTFLELCEEALENIAAHSRGISVIVGVPVQENGRTISAAVLIESGKIKRCVGKKYVNLRDEMGYIYPSKGYETADICGEHVAIVVGDDLRRIKNFDRSVTTIINVAARRYRKRVLESRYEELHHLAYVECKNVVFVNQVGGATDIVFDGTSSVYDRTGEMVTLLDTFGEDFKVCDLARENEPIQTPFSYYKNRTSNLYAAIKCGLRDFFRKNNYTRACVGLSGGIDSSVVVSIAVDTLGAENVRALMMPSQFSTEHSVNDAVQLAENLQIQYEIIPIEPVYNVFMQQLSPIVKDTPFGLTEENLQARIRGSILMASANKQGAMVLNTSNKSEAACGYGTLYGDLCGGLSVLGDLYKSQVYDLARFINRKKEIIPVNCITKAPSAELHPGQKDSDSLPDYDTIEKVLRLHLEKKLDRKEIEKEGVDARSVKRILDLFYKNVFKRRQTPPIIRLSITTLDKDILLPLVCR